MDPDEEFFEASQQLTQDDGEGTNKKKKKKKKSKRNLDEDFANLEDVTLEDDSQSQSVYTQQSVTQEDIESEEPSTSTPKKKKKKKKKAKNDDDEEEDPNLETEITLEAPQTPGPSSSKKLSPKKEPVTPAKSVPPPPKPKTSDTDERTTGINILASMSHDDLELLLNKVGAECPVNEAKVVKKREMEIDWTKIAFSCYSADHCRMAWSFLQSQTRKYRIMHELVEEVKFNLKTDYHKFMRKSIEAAPNFPKQPYALGAFQYFCKEKWDEHKHLQEKMKKKVENFLTFQTQCHKRWTSLTDEQKQHYDQQAKLLKAEYNQKVREFYANYPAFLTKKELKLDKDGKPEVKDKPMSDHLRKKTVKISQEIFQDAPKFPSTPMQLYLNSKLNEMEPPPTAAELPSYKKQLCDKWKELSNKKKLKWIKKCIKACEHYQMEVTQYKKTHPMFFLSKELQMSKLINKDEFNIWADNHGKPPKPKNTVYDYFVEEFQNSAEAAGKSDEEVTSAAEKKWKELPRLDLQRYQVGYKMYQLNFLRDIEKYLETVPDMMRACVIDSLPKKYKMEFLEKVNKEPLVKDDDLIEVDDDGEEPSTSKKRKRGTNNGEESSDEKKKKKRQDPGSLPLYAEDLGDEHKELLEKNLSEMKRAKAVEEEQKANNYSPGKNITPQIINEAIRGIFDGRQFERRFTVYYYYAKYICREKTWCTLYSKIGIVETAARMIETFNRLTKQEKQIFLDQALEFHNTLRHYSKNLTNEEEIFAPKLRLFPEEPKPPPRKATLLYKQESQVAKLKNPDPDHHPVPTWDQLDQNSQMFYLKKLYKLHREYIMDYEKFVRNMTPNDMIEYLIRQAQSWNSAAQKGKGHTYFDHNIYSTAVALRTQVTRETYSLEMSDDGQESEPELYSMEDGGSLINGAQKFHYKPNPFWVPKRSRGRPRKNPRSLIDKICSSKKHNNSDSSSYSSSSSSEGEDDNVHDETSKFGNLVLSDRKKKLMKKFQRKLKKTERYNYPLMDEFYEPFDCLKIFKQASHLGKEDSKREVLSQITENQAKWENIRNIINSKPNLPLHLPKNFGKKAFKKATNKKVTLVKRKAGGKIVRKKKSRVCRKAPSTIEKLMMKNAMCLLKDQSYERRRSRRKQKAAQQVHLDDDDEYEDVVDDETEDGRTPTTLFIRTAAQSEAETRENTRKEMTPELESLSQPPPPPPPRRPGLVLVRRSPSPMKQFVFKEPMPVPRKRVSSLSQKEQSPSPLSQSPVSVEQSPTTPQSPRRSQQQHLSDTSTTDEFQLLDTLADFESGQGIFSESELNQLGDYN